MELTTHVDRPRGSDKRLAAEPRVGNAESVTDAVAQVAVAFNGSPQSRDALMLGVLVARSTGSKLVVACVFPPDSLADMTFEPRAARVARDDHRIFVRQDAEAVLVEARAALPDDLAVDYRALECESPRGGLRQLALSESIDLLVLGSSHRGPVAQLLPLGVVRSLLRRPPCALAVAPSGFRYRKHSALRQLVVAHDQSPASERALDVAAAFAVQIAASSTAATSVRVFRVAAKSSPAPSPGEVELAARADIDGRIAKLAGFGGDVDYRNPDATLQIYTSATAARSDPTAGLIDITTSEADCLIIDWPCRRNSRRGRRLHRATLLRRAGCPLLLVPAGIRSPFLASFETARRLGRSERTAAA
jgi:nucleotide-binding universal stress UspA family protein